MKRFGKPNDSTRPHEDEPEVKSSMYFGERRVLSTLRQCHIPLSNAGIISLIGRFTDHKKKITFSFFFFSPPEYAAEFVLTLASNATDLDQRALFGKHVRLLHESCQRKLLKFTKQAHALGKKYKLF